jgi:hypothetical protein
MGRLPLIRSLDGVLDRIQLTVQASGMRNIYNTWSFDSTADLNLRIERKENGYEQTLPTTIKDTVYNLTEKTRQLSLANPGRSMVPGSR